MCRLGLGVPATWLGYLAPGSGDPKPLVLVLDARLNLAGRFQKRYEPGAYILWFKIKLGLSSMCSKNV